MGSEPDWQAHPVQCMWMGWGRSMDVDKTICQYLEDWAWPPRQVDLHCSHHWVEPCQGNVCRSVCAVPTVLHSQAFCCPDLHLHVHCTLYMWMHIYIHLCMCMEKWGRIRHIHVHNLKLEVTSSITCTCGNYKLHVHVLQIVLWPCTCMYTHAHM